jgi:hypothetical protein
MVDGLYIHIQNRSIKPLEIVLRGVGRVLGQGKTGGELTNKKC